MNTPLINVINALGLTLAHFLWEGAALAAILLFFHRANPRARYAAACAVLLAMPLAFAATFSRMWNVPDGAGMSGLAATRALVLDAVETGNGSPAAPAASLWTWLVPVWMAGVAVFYLRSLGGWIAARRFQRTGVIQPDAAWRMRF